MQGTPIANRQLHKVISAIKKDFLPEIQYISICKMQDTTRIFFISNDNVDCTHKFLEKKIRSLSVYNYILSEIDKSSIAPKIIQGQSYYIKIPQRNFASFLDNNFFFLIRKKSGLDMKDICLNIGVSTQSVYSAENWYKDISASTIIRYAVYFNEPIFNFFSKQFRNLLIKDIANYLSDNKYISEEQRKNIISEEGKKNP